MNYQKKYITRSSFLLEYQNFLKHCSSYLRFLHFDDNYFDSPTKLLSDLIYLTKFLSISAKSFFSCTSWKMFLLHIPTPYYRDWDKRQTRHFYRDSGKIHDFWYFDLVYLFSEINVI